MPHIHEKIDFTVSAYIVHENKVLLRMHDKYNLWLPPGGHVELDENTDEAVKREALEETGYEIKFGAPGSTRLEEDTKYKDLTTPDFMNIHFAHPPHQHLDLTYFVTLEHPNQADVKEEDKHAELKWFLEEELDDPRYEIEKRIKFYAKQALKKFSS